jgi:hypothetical protein
VKEFMMEANQEKSTDKRVAWFEHVLDVLPFIFAVFVIVLVILAMMSTPINNIYTNTVNVI